MNNSYQTKILSSLVKVFPDETPAQELECQRLTALIGETVSFQLAYKGASDRIDYGKLSVKSDLKDNVTLRSVELVPSAYPCHPDVDDNYLRTTPGMYPDLLRPLDNGRIFFVANQWRALWIDVDVTDAVKAGKHEIAIQVEDYSGKPLFEARTELLVYDCRMPKQSLIHTEWFHADCIADYYKVTPWSEQHFELCEAFIKTAAKRGINMLLVPTHTPPLDTAVGGEITTVQLVDITVLKDGSYSFGYDKLKRFIDIAMKAGIEYFEIAHLFTQWGAKAAPKFVAQVNGEQKRIFGWDTPAIGGEYTVFLQQYLSGLLEKLHEWNIAEKCFFHISDEPSAENLSEYLAAKQSVETVLRGMKIIDALSDYEFYKRGIVQYPIPANDHIGAFIEGGVPHLWTYYCTAQNLEVSNRFMSMPSARNRALGLQLYLYNIEGFLHWGYNFYNSQFSMYQINPYAVTDAMGAFPSGDPFLVYPGADGVPEESIRLMVLSEALCDMRALQLLQSLTSYEFVYSLIHEGLDEKITFKRYPHSDMYYLQLRNRVNSEIAKRK